MRFPVNPRLHATNALVDGLLYTVRRVNEAVRLLPTDGVLLVDAGIPTAGLVVALPLAHDVPGRAFLVKKIDTSKHPVTIATAGSDLVDGEKTLTFKVPGEARLVVSDGASRWWSVGDVASMAGSLVIEHNGTALPEEPALNFLDPIVAVDNPGLSTDVTLGPSGVTPGTYGDATHSLRATIDAHGLVTAAASIPITGGSGTPGGADTDVQYNDGGVFGGDASLTWNKTTRTLTVGDATHAGLLLVEDGAGTALQLTQNPLGGGQIDGSTSTGTGPLQVFGMNISKATSVVGGGLRALAIDIDAATVGPITIEDSVYTPLFLPGNYILRSPNTQAFFFAFNANGTITITDTTNTMEVGLFNDGITRLVDGTTQTLTTSLSFSSNMGYSSINGGILVVSDSEALDDAVTLTYDGTPGGSVTVVKHAAIESHPALDAGTTMLIRRGLWFEDFQGSGTAPTQVAVDVEDLRATLALSLRSVGPLVELHQVGNVIIGADTTPAEKLNVTAGNVQIDGGGATGYVDIGEFNVAADPSAPGVGHGRLYMRDNGSGKVQLAARFPTGAVQVIATEP